MNFYWIKTNTIFKKIFSRYTWDIPNTENKIYVTFDDGPIPKITEWVLAELKKQNVKATFFCIGNNIKAHPELFSKIIDEGHLIGNHTTEHCNGWKTNTTFYTKSVDLCKQEILKAYCPIPLLFRPPYGKIKPKQGRQLNRSGYKIIMWDVLSADFDPLITPEKCLENVIENVKSGSIIVFHDSVKAFENLKYALPRAIEILKNKGFVFDVIP